MAGELLMTSSGHIILRSDGRLMLKGAGGQAMNELSMSDSDNVVSAPLGLPADILAAIQAADQSTDASSGIGTACSVNRSRRDGRQ